MRTEPKSLGNLILEEMDRIKKNPPHTRTFDVNTLHAKYTSKEGNPS